MTQQMSGLAASLKFCMMKFSFFQNNLTADGTAHVGKNGNGLILQHDFQPSSTGNTKSQFSFGCVTPFAMG